MADAPFPLPAPRAERQYQAVEPENRLVARSLERQWEEALRKQRDLEADHVGFVQETSAETALRDVSVQGGSPAGGDVAQGTTLLR